MQRRNEVQISNWINKINFWNLILIEGNIEKQESIKDKKGMILLVLLQEWSIKFYILDLQVSWTVDQM